MVSSVLIPKNKSKINSHQYFYIYLKYFALFFLEDQNLTSKWMGTHLNFISCIFT